MSAGCGSDGDAGDGDAGNGDPEAPPAGKGMGRGGFSQARPSAVTVPGSPRAGARSLRGAPGTAGGSLPTGGPPPLPEGFP